MVQGLCTLADLLLRALWQLWGLRQGSLIPHGPSGRRHSLDHQRSQLHIKQHMVKGKMVRGQQCYSMPTTAKPRPSDKV